jgi:hypothetical protein
LQYGIAGREAHRGTADDGKSGAEGQGKDDAGSTPGQRMSLDGAMAWVEASRGELSVRLYFTKGTIDGKIGYFKQQRI